MQILKKKKIKKKNKKKKKIQKTKLHKIYFDYKILTKMQNICMQKLANLFGYRMHTLR